MGAPEDIQAMIDRLRALEKLPQVAAPLVAKELEAEIRADIAKGQSPDGAKWPARKDGGKALANAGAALKVTTHGPVVVAQLTGPTAMHHLGRGKGGVRRQILPTRVPTKIVAVLQKTVAKIMAGGVRG